MPMTAKQIAAAEAAELAKIRAKIDALLAPLEDIAMLDRHHRALRDHVRQARKTLPRACDLTGAKECAEHLHRAYTLPRGHRFAERALEWLADRPARPFEGSIDLRGGFGFFRM